MSGKLFATVAAIVAVALAGQSAPVAADAEERHEYRPPVVISEVLQNPAITWDSRGEWFELYNRSHRPVDVDGWTIADDDVDLHVIDNGGPLVIGPGGYLVIGRNPDTATNGGVELDYSYGNDVFLFNGWDELAIYDTTDRQVDHVPWDDGLSFPDPNGASMALVDAWSDNSVGQSWCVSTTIFGVGDLGTPGSPTSCEPAPALVISEIMQNPHAVGDGLGEWFEIHNPTSEPVNLAGWTIRDDDDDRHAITEDVIVAPGEYLVVGLNGNAALNGGVIVDYAMGREVRLWNSSDELVLVDPHGARADRVRWDNGVTFPDPTGAAMVLNHLGSDNSRGQNWCVATTAYGAGDLGTPGSENTCDPVPTSAPEAPLVITEVLQNPAATYDRHGEWFEIQNPSDVAIDLVGWIIRDDDTNRHVIATSTVVEAGGYVVLGKVGDPAVNGGVDVDYAYGSAMTLYNGNDEIVLLDRNGVAVDWVRWDDGRTFPDPDGAAMALIDAASNNAVGEHWCVETVRFGAGDAGSPGGPNPCLPPEPEAPLVINEILNNPQVVPDSVGEWFELYNPTDRAVDIDGWTIKDDDWNRHVIDADGALVVPAGGYLVLGRSADPTANGGVDVAYGYGTGQVLHNASDELVLLDTNGTEVDRVVWDDGATFPDPDGASMTLLGPRLDNALASSWCVARLPFGQGDAGTPGRRNTCDAPPELAVTVTPSSDVLWPPNNKWHDVATVVDVEGASGPIRIELVGVEMNEEPGKWPDFEIINDYNFRFRARRYGSGDGRIYTITYKVRDASGQTVTAEATVTVPHNQ